MSKENGSRPPIDIFADQTGIPQGIVKDHPAGKWNPVWKLDDVDTHEEHRERQEQEEHEAFTSAVEAQLYNE